MNIELDICIILVISHGAMYTMQISLASKTTCILLREGFHHSKNFFVLFDEVYINKVNKLTDTFFCREIRWLEVNDVFVRLRS